MLDQLASESVAAWYNRLLAREDWARAVLAPHAGCTARILAGPVSVLLAIRPDGTLAGGDGPRRFFGGAGAADSEAAAPSVTITLDPQAIAGSLLDPGAVMRQVQVAGDAAFAQALTDVLPKLRPDPAEDLARFIGDAPAERVTAAFNSALTQLREGASRLARQGADYFAAEFPLLVGTREFDRFRMELAELQARLERLEATHAAPATGRTDA